MEVRTNQGRGTHKVQFVQGCLVAQHLPDPLLISGECEAGAWSCPRLGQQPMHLPFPQLLWLRAPRECKLTKKRPLRSARVV